MAGIPAQMLAGNNIAIAIVIAVLGTSGMFLKRRPLALAASLSLLLLLISGKVTDDLLKIGQPDTAVLLLEFSAIVFFMEAGRTVLAFDGARRDLAEKSDEVSRTVRLRLTRWVENQLREQGRLASASVGLSLVLLVVGSITSVSFDQLVVSAGLVILSMGVLLFVLTYRREPESQTHTS